MVCTKISLWKIKTYIHCPEPGQSSDMDRCCGNLHKYPGQYCCNGLKSGLYSVGETIGIIIGVFSAVILLAYLVIKCCRNKPTPPDEPGNHLVVAPTAGTTSANAPDVSLLEYSILPPSGPLNQPHIEYSKTFPTDAQDQPPPYPGPPDEDQKQPSKFQ